MAFEREQFEPLLIFVCLPYSTCDPSLCDKPFFWKHFTGLSCVKDCQKFLKCSDRIFCTNYFSGGAGHVSSRWESFVACSRSV
jgi:hypothetical protein